MTARRCLPSFSAMCQQGILFFPSLLHCFMKPSDCHLQNKLQLFSLAKSRKKSDVHVLIVLIQSKLVACTSPSASYFPIPRDRMAHLENSWNFSIESPQESKSDAKRRYNRWVTASLGDCALLALQLVLQDCHRCLEWHGRHTVSVSSLASWKRIHLKKSILPSVYVVDPRCSSIRCEKERRA